MRKSLLLTVLVLAVAAGGSYGLYLYLRPAVLPAQLLYGNGHVEGTEVRVAAEVSARVVENQLVEGTKVSRGQVLVRLDDADFSLNAQRIGAEIDALRRQRERAEREQEASRHHLRTAEIDLARYRELRERGTIAPQRLEQAENAFQEARGQLTALESEIAAIAARIVAAEKQREIVANQIEKTIITAPTPGTVLAKAVEAGEYVQPGQTVAVLVDLSRLNLKVFIPEKDIGKVKLRAPARVRFDAFPDKLFEARVARVDQQAQFTPRDIHMPQERVRLVFGLTLSLDNPEGALKPGMPADAWILWQEDDGWPEPLFVPQ